MTNPFAFIVGNPRSGTTLLRHIVDSHSEIACLLESPWFMNWAEKQIGVDAQGFVTPGLVPHLLASRRVFRDVDLGLTADEMQGWIEKPSGLRWEDFISMLCDRYGSARGKLLVGNKTPGFVRRIAAMHKLWPTAKFVHIIRDGRDVFLSARVKWKQEPTSPQFKHWMEDQVTTAALWWEWNVRLGREAGRLLDANLYYELRYERLVANPENECMALCKFLGVRFEDAMLRHEQQFKIRHHKDDGRVINARVALPITAGLRNWQSEMTAEEQQRFEAAAGSLLDELVYARHFEQCSPESLEHARQARNHFEARPLPEAWDVYPKNSTVHQIPRRVTR